MVVLSRILQGQAVPKFCLFTVFDPLGFQTLNNNSFFSKITTVGPLCRFEQLEDPMVRSKLRCLPRVEANTGANFSVAIAPC